MAIFDNTLVALKKNIFNTIICFIVLLTSCGTSNKDDATRILSEKEPLISIPNKCIFKYAISDDAIFIYDKPSEESKIIDSLFISDSVCFLNKTNYVFKNGFIKGNWIRVKHNNITGFVKNIYFIKYKTPNKNILRKLTFDNFLKNYLDSNNYLIQHINTHDDYLSEKKYTIKTINIGNVYELFKLLDMTYKYPKILTKNVYYFANRPYQLNVEQIDNNENNQNILKLTWVCEGGEESYKVIEKDSNIVIYYKGIVL